MNILDASKYKSIPVNATVGTALGILNTYDDEPLLTGVKRGDIITTVNRGNDYAVVKKDDGTDHAIANWCKIKHGAALPASAFKRVLEAV